jgi:sugar phosphate isomerase/epimerase
MNIAGFGMDTASLAGPLEARLAAMKAAGFSQVMLAAGDVAAHPGGPQAVAAAVKAAGLQVTGLQVLADFEGLEGRLHAYKLDIAKAMLTLCGTLGSRLLLVSASTSAHASDDPEHIARDLRKLAMLALPHGIRLAYQPLSWGRAIRDVMAASEVVSLADMSNLGLALDAFNLFAAGTAIDELDMIEPWKIFLVQLSDFMGLPPRGEAELVSSARDFRVFPGEGTHGEELARLVKRLDRLGYRGGYSLEVFNQDYHQLPPSQVADRARRSALWLAEDVLQRSAAPFLSPPKTRR